MNKKTLFALILISLLAFSVAGKRYVLAVDTDVEDTSEEAEKVEDLLDQIKEYEEKIDDLQGDANTLSREIDSINANIHLTELQIQNSINKIAAIRSSRWIQGNHWFPLPREPPTNILNAGIILARAPPFFSRTTPNRMTAILAPFSAACRASFSQSRDTWAKKSWPTLSSSFRISSPLFP